MKQMVKQKLSIFDCVNTLLMLCIILMTVYPIWYTVCISLSSTQYIAQNEVSVLPLGFNLAAYKLIFKTPTIIRSYYNSILYTAIGTTASVFFTALMAYPLAKKRLVFQKPVMYMAIITMFFSGGLIPTYLVVQSMGLMNTMWSLIIPNLVWGFELIVLINFFKGVPYEIHEAAVIDGASEFSIFSKIYLPYAKPALATIALYYALSNWNSYLIPSLYFSSPEKYPLQVVLREMLVLDNTNPTADAMQYASITPEALKNAVMVVATVPILIFYPYIQKYFVKGLMVGAVKG